MHDTDIPPGTVCILNGSNDLGIYAKMRRLLWGEVVVVRRLKGGAYMIQELDGAPIHERVGKSNLDVLEDMY